MIHNIKQAIAEQLIKLYPKTEVYDEFVAQNLKGGSFFIDVVEQDYKHTLFQTGKSDVQFDISYFPQTGRYPNSEMEDVGSTLLRAFRAVGGYRICRKQKTIVDGVLHIALSISYNEAKDTEQAKIAAYTLNEKIKEEN